jgi:glycosyltransferase involved in cell wall biosynthesis
MKVLLVHISDFHNGGGGGVAMHRLHVTLKGAGIDSKILCGTKTVQSPDVFRIPRLGKLERPLRRITSNLGLNDIHLLGSFKVKHMAVYQQADIIDFQGIHSNTLSYLALPGLTVDKPAVFTLHDMWALTGHCANSRDCNRWQTGCGHCPYLDTHPPVKRDNTRLEWKLKDWAYRHSKLTIAAPSRWLVEQAKQSMLQRFSIHHIPNGVDTDVYEPLDPDQCRSLLGIPPDKKVLMVCALDLKNYLKGGDLFLKALQNLPASLKKEIVLLTIGNGGEVISQAANIPTFDFGFVSSDRLKALCYSAADLFIHPSRAENLPLVLLESMACGTPMVSFNVGGVPELVRPDSTGYLAKPESAKDLAAGIVQLLEDKTKLSYMSRQCRAIVLEEYTLELQAQRYIELYRQLMQDSIIQTVDDKQMAPDLLASR